MKQTFTAIAVLTMMIIGTFLHIHTLENLTETVSAELVNCIDRCSSQNRIRAETALAGAKTQWNGHRTYAHIFLHHDTIDGIDDLFREAGSALKQEDYTETSFICENLLNRFDRLLQDETPCLKSIF